MKNIVSRTIAAILLSACVVTQTSLATDSSSHNSDSRFSYLLRYARLAHVAYQDPDHMGQISREQALIFEGSGSLEIEKVGYFIAKDPVTKSMFISIRGTSNLENALIDISYTLQEDSHTGIRLHTGFSQSAANLYRELKPRIEVGYTVHLTGHSLGGAVALILAMHLAVDSYKVGDVVTFGQPKVTNRSGASRFENLNVIRIVTEHDMVPIMPPFDISDLMSVNMDIFWHLGKAHVLLPGQYYATLEGLNSLRHGMGFFNKKPSQENIDAHRMETYLNLVEEKVNRSVSIAYEELENHVAAPR
ncbi:MAG: lipase family protein [Gammaproteobacteria bacterium]|nr:lipase family protein [Gammaproteobacteria bacterium]